jgi:ATP-dependent protease HslVU (ClpYQ) peptidase subunit
MSVVAIRKYEDGVIEIASDSVSISDNLKQPSKKIFRLAPNFVVGSVGYTHVKLLFQRFFEEKKKVPNATVSSLVDYMTEFRIWYKNKGYPVERLEDTTFMFVIYDKMFSATDTSVSEIEEYWAIGSGGEVALGALSYGATAKTAVTIAIDLISTCGGEPNVFQIYNCKP